MKVLPFAAFLNFIFETLNDISFKIKNPDLKSSINECCSKLAVWVKIFEELFQKPLNLDKLTIEEREEVKELDNSFELNYQQAIDIKVGLIDLKKSLTEVHESPLLEDLKIFKKLITMVSLIDRLILDLDYHIDSQKV